MLELTIFNVVLILIIVGILILAKKFIKTEKAKNITLLISSLLTILCHYSSIVYHLIVNGTAMHFLTSNPNLILPIYPCNVVMWCCLIYGLIKNKNGKFGSFLADYIFWFGIISCAVGLFANVDFIKNPSFNDYDVVKGIVAHAFMLFNVLLLCVFGRIKIDLTKNLVHIIISVVMMLFIGLYCNLVFSVLASSDTAYQVNSMFLIHSPFDGIDFLTYPLISLIAIVGYFITFNICEFFAYKKGNRWIARIKNE